MTRRPLFWIVLTALLAAGAGVGGRGWLLARRAGPLHLAASVRDSLGPVGPCTLKPRMERPDCYRAALSVLVREQGTAGAMAALKRVGLADGDIEREGHVYAHGIGIEGYQARQSVAGTFDGCPIDYSSGCRHGVIQAYLESQATVDSVTLNGLCSPWRGRPEASWDFFQCTHGTGHGLDMMYGGDLPRALDSCDLLRDFVDRDACYGGAFMENIMEEIQPHHPASELAASHEHMHHGNGPAWKRLDPADPLYPCSKMAERFWRPCYEIQTSAILNFNKWNIPETAKSCDAAPAGMIATCYKSLGRDITSRTLRDPDRTRKLCDQAGAHWRPWCYFGAVKSLIDWNADPGAGMTFCRKLGDRRGWVFCYRGVGEQIIALGKPDPERNRLCAVAGRPEGVEACRYGAALPGSKLPRDDSTGE